MSAYILSITIRPIRFRVHDDVTWRHGELTSSLQGLLHGRLRIPWRHPVALPWRRRSCWLAVGFPRPETRWRQRQVLPGTTAALSNWKHQLNNRTQV